MHINGQENPGDKDSYVAYSSLIYSVSAEIIFEQSYLFGGLENNFFCFAVESMKFLAKQFFRLRRSLKLLE